MLATKVSYSCSGAFAMHIIMIMAAILAAPERMISIIVLIAIVLIAWCFYNW
jgi:alkylhydroperoxidase/carboxymuconolactone decarboxylase family protein YurZ